MPELRRVIQWTVVPAWLTSKSLGLSERRCDSQHPLRRSTKIPENPRTRDSRQNDRTCLPSILLKAGRVSTRFRAVSQFGPVGQDAILRAGC